MIPEAQLIPYMSSGATDSRFFRERDIVAYGMQMESSLDVYGAHARPQ